LAAAATSSRRDRCQPSGRADDGEVTVLVRTEHAGAEAFEHVEGDGGGVPVVVVAADADERHPGPEACVERRVLLGGSVVGDLDDVHGRAVGDDRRDGSLGVGLDVPEGEDAGALNVDGQDDARVVDRVAGVLSRCGPATRTAWWPEDPPGQRPAGVGEVAGHSGHAARHRGARGPDRARGAGESRGGL
jgi:hypothetical protein